MAKTYKHKQTWWIAKEEDDSYEYDRDWSRTAWSLFYIPKELIENSNDRELQPEEDWIDGLIRELCIEFKASAREKIEKYMPKITEEELQNCCDLWIELTIEKVENLLKEKWLYLDITN